MLWLASHDPILTIVMRLLPVIEKAIVCWVPVSVAFDVLLRGLSKASRANKSISLFQLSLVIVR